MQKQSSLQMKLRRLLTTIGLVVFTVSMMPGSVQASQITARSLTLSSSVSAAVTTHKFTFTVPTATAIKSVRLRYCTTASGACVVPTAWANMGGTMGSVTNLGTGFAIDLATNSDSYGLTSAGNVTAPSTPVTINITNAKNPTSASQPYSFYVRISTYSDVAYTTALDTGNVSAAINSQIILTGTMPESLVFCTGGTVTGTDCTTATSGSVTFGAEFSPTVEAIATSQMVASTNAGSGYAVTVNGTTMTSGGNTVTAMSPATTSTLGVSQFGLNVMVNTTPAVGTATTPASNGTNYKALGNTGYGTANTFKFLTGDTVASSTSGGAGSSDAQNITVSYIVNVPGSQPAGTYTTTLTYICTATF